MKYAILMCAGALLWGSLAQAQKHFAYPSQGQSKEQQRLDQSECSSWASVEIGFDPANPPPIVSPPPPQGPQGDALRSAARGAARRWARSWTTIGKKARRRQR